MTDEEKKLIRQTSLDKRLALRQNERFIVNPIFPCGALHIISGPGSIGKTTWFWQMLHDWELGKPVFGYPSNPCPWVYIGMDRGHMDADRSLRRLGFADWDAPVYAIEDIIPRSTRGDIELEPQISHVVDKFPDAQLYVIEGLQGFMPNTGRGQSQNKAEQIWAMKLRDSYLNKGKTIIATTHSPKSSDLKSNREAMLGSQALIGASGTIIQFALPDTAEKKGVVMTNERIVTVMGKDFANIYCHYELGERGEFILKEQKSARDFNVDNVPSIENPAKTKLMEDWIDAYPIGTEMTTKQLEEVAEGISMQRSSLYHWINRQMAVGKLLKEGRGVYRRSAAQ